MHEARSLGSVDPNSTKMVVREVQSAKHETPSRPTEAGMRRDASDEHPINAKSAISRRCDTTWKVTCSRETHAWKQLQPIISTDLGMQISFSPDFRNEESGRQINRESRTNVTVASEAH
jgi:hypothetical protein